MPIDFSNIGVVILAAGQGKRMKSHKLKVMHELHGRPLIDYVVSAVEKSGLAVKPVVVVNERDDSVQQYLGERAIYVTQTEQLGTGHALAQAQSLLKGKVKQVVVLYGDMPFVESESISKIAKNNIDNKSKITLMTVAVDEFSGWKGVFADYGRIIRSDLDNHIVGIVEKKDANTQQLEIKEINTGFFCFDEFWLWPHLQALQNNNNQAEYYLTDLVAMAMNEGVPVSSIAIDPREAVGVNSVEQLEKAEKLIS